LSGKSLVKTALPLLIGVVIIVLAAALGVAAFLNNGCHAIPELSGCAIVKLPADNLSADFYEGSQLLAAGANSVTVALSPGQTRRIVVQKITDNGFQPSDLFVYEDTSLDVTVPPGKVQTFFISPLKDYLKGKISLTCDTQGIQIGDDIACRPVIDGTPQPDLRGGSASTYALDIGQHTVHVELTGEDVTECTGGARGLVDGDLARAYRSQVDPRLNYEQALEMAMIIAQRMSASRGA
jgi:hypothetical protein